MYLEIDEGFLGHRKTLRLCAALKNPEAPAFMLRLWTWACRSAPDGDLAGMDPYDIEIAVQYRPLDGACYAAMVAAGFIDQSDGRPASIHNWMKRTGGAIAKMAAAAERKSLYRSHKTGKCCPNDCPFCLDSSASMDSPRTDQGQSADESHPDQTRPVQTRQDQDPDPESSEAPAPSEPAEPALVVFPCVGKGAKKFSLTRSMVDAWSDAWPGVDVLAEAKKALAWVNANPSKRKTPQGMPAFLTRWCNRAQDRSGGARGSPPAARPPSTATRDAFADLLSKANP